jgi:hypothetical protein
MTVAIDLSSPEGLRSTIEGVLARQDDTQAALARLSGPGITTEAALEGSGSRERALLATARQQAASKALDCGRCHASVRICAPGVDGTSPCLHTLDACTCARVGVPRVQPARACLHTDHGMSGRGSIAHAAWPAHSPSTCEALYERGCPVTAHPRCQPAREQPASTALDL